MSSTRFGRGGVALAVGMIVVPAMGLGAAPGAGGTAAGGPGADGGPLAVVSVEPAPRSMTAPANAAIEIEFDRPVDRSTVTRDSFWAFGRWSGTAEGTVSFLDGDVRAVLTPDHPFSAGEMVMVILSHDIRGADGIFLRSAGYSFQFMTRAGAADRDFEEIDVLSTRTVENESSRAYGGIASDMNGDRFLDMTIVNEDTADLRVFLNRADGTGLFDDFIQPPFPVGNRASPSEPADFDRDGAVDICVANINDDTVSVLLGNGDGTFGPQQVIAVGGDPRGIAVLDVDGDGDVDIVNTNATSNSMSLMLNDGNGVFGPATFFEAGVSGEWALAAADMNEDGILDAVVGGRSGRQVIVNMGNGDGTFTPGTPAGIGGAVWMIACGDVDGDGHDDVAAANSSTNNGAILRGDGAGNLGSLQTRGTDPFPLATDLGDLDGDGDLDWVTSSFGGDWFVFTNDGAGIFAFDQELLAPRAASCSLLFDFDNDGDLDLGLIDELADVVMLMRNAGSPCPADVDDSGTVDFADLLAILAAWGPCPGCPEDIDGNGTVDFADLLAVLAAWGPCV